MLPRLKAISNHLLGTTLTTASRMSSTVHNTNKACCTIPPVQSDYQPKGTFKEFGSLKKVYITGPENSEKKVVCVYDIFGFFPQTQQGADLIASTLKATVYMPDFFEPNPPFPSDNFPPKTDEEKKKLQEFFGGTANPGKAIENLTKFGKKLREDGAKNVGAYGFCWGGKVSLNAGGQGTPFDGVAIVHPAMLSDDDAHKLTVPLGIYPSKDEPKDEYRKILGTVGAKPFASKNDSKYYENMFHGWAAARANLDDAENKKEFEDVYNRLVNFFNGVFA